MFSLRRTLYRQIWSLHLLLTCTFAQAQNNPAVLQIRVVQGEGAVYAAGSRATRGIVVQVTDEMGKPVEGAAITFRLPDSGATGTFSSGGKTENANTGSDGRAEVWGMEWGRAAGAFEMRITAAKGSARGGTVCPLYISDAPVLTGSTDKNSTQEPKASGGSKKKMWILIGAAAAAGVAVIGVAGKGGSDNGSAPPPSGPNPPQVGSPSITISRP